MNELCSVLMRPLKSQRKWNRILVVLVVIILITIINALRLRLAFLVEMAPRHVRVVPPNNFSCLEQRAYIVEWWKRETYSSFPGPFSPLLNNDFRTDLRWNSGV
jgi:hypothetical protein